MKRNLMTLKIFWRNPYLTELTTTVKTVEGTQVTLRETIFYPFLGGQESDSGTIGNYPVLNAQKEGMEIYYTLPTDHQLKANDPVKIIINWKRRYKLMRLHFAAEIVLELMYQQFPGIPKVGAHIAENKARIDFQWNTSLSPALPEIQRRAQLLIDENHPIISAFSDESTERRYWKIEAFPPVPCGGTHLKTTGEIGIVSLKRINPGKGLERIEIYVEEKKNDL